MPIIASLIALLALHPQTGSPTDITVYEDKHGVPSIVASNLKSGAYALGYCQAKDHAQRMALNYKLARGRLAEVNGKSSLLQDGFLRGLGFEAKAEGVVARLRGEPKEVVEGFLAGANRALSEQKATLPKWIEPFSDVDVISLTQFVNAAFPLLDLSAKISPGAGSNQFALAPSRTATQHPILSIDPHLGWDGQDGGIVWQEFALYTPDVHFRGVAIPGLPLGVIGHNDRIAWSMTNNNPQLYSIYTFKTNPENRSEYSYHGTWKPFRTVKTEMRYLENGQLKSNISSTKATEWGPIVPFSSKTVRLSVPEPDKTLEQALLMMRAKTASSFREALKTRGLSMWNYVYADIEGNIGYQYNAYVPQRDASFDWNKTLPGEDPKTAWGDLWSLDALPHIENPSSGILVNCNSSPKLVPIAPEIPGDWPVDVTSYGRSTRWQMLSSLLKDAHHVTPDKAKEFATDCTVPFAKETIESLAKVVDPGAAIDVLKRWDGKAKIDSVGCVLYTYWLRQSKDNPELSSRAASGQAWSTDQAKLAKDSLVSAAQQMQKEQGSLTTRWGGVQFMERGTVKRPVQGFGYVAAGSPIAAVSPASAGAETLKQGRSHATFGSSFRMVVSLDPKGVQSWSILPYGNSNVASSAHFADQMELYSVGKYKPTNFGLKNVSTTSTKTYHLQY